MLFETLSDCLNTVRQENIKNNIETIVDNFEPMNYDTVQRKSFPIESIKGKKTRKYCHVIITRFNCGRYELVNYCL